MALGVVGKEKKEEGREGGGGRERDFICGTERNWGIERQRSRPKFAQPPPLIIPGKCGKPSSARRGAVEYRGN
jgi:hypothetical protein